VEFLDQLSCYQFLRRNIRYELVELLLLLRCITFYVSDVGAEWLALLLRIQESFGSDLSTDMDILTEVFVVFFTHPRKALD
jgi:hypothetical protein